MKLIRSSLVLFVIQLFFLTLFVSDSVAQSEELSPTPTPATNLSVNSYELFWPISAGRVMGDQLYSLKLFKEGLREAFIFNDSKKAEYNVSLSTKRVVEAEKLYMANKDYENGKLSLDAGQRKREKARDLLKQTEAKGKNVTDLKNSMISVFERQGALLNYMSTQVPAGQKKAVDDNVSQLNSVIATLQ